MHGVRAAAKALLAFLCCLAALAVVGCATRPFTVKPDDPLFGTWVNKDVDEGRERGYAKSVLTPDGRELDYRRIADTVPAYEATFTIEAAWIDRQGNRWYKLKGLFWIYGTEGAKTEMFNLVKVSPDGNDHRVGGAAERVSGQGGTGHEPELRHRVPAEVGSAEDECTDQKRIRITRAAKGRCAVSALLPDRARGRGRGSTGDPSRRTRAGRGSARRGRSSSYRLPTADGPPRYAGKRHGSTKAFTGTSVKRLQGYRRRRKSDLGILAEEFELAVLESDVLRNRRSGVRDPNEVRGR